MAKAKRPSKKKQVEPEPRVCANCGKPEPERATTWMRVFPVGGDSDGAVVCSNGCATAWLGSLATAS